jgi:hypothetical protein
MPQIRYSILICPFLAPCAPVLAQVCALRKDEQPHGVKALGSRQRSAVAGAQLAQPVLKALLICRPLAREEYEAEEHHAGAEDGYPPQRVFEDDVEVAVHVSSVAYPPEVDPVGVDLTNVSFHHPGFALLQDEPGDSRRRLSSQESHISSSHPPSSAVVPSHSHRHSLAP